VISRPEIIPAAGSFPDDVAGVQHQRPVGAPATAMKVDRKQTIASRKIRPVGFRVVFP